MIIKKWLSFIIAVLMVLSICCPVVQGAEPVDITAQSAILVDAETGKFLYQKNINQKLPPASMTKLMTLVLAFEDLERNKVSLDEKVITSENAWKMGGSQIYLEPGEEMSFRDMLYAIALGSANDACVAIAEHLEGSHEAFVARMNKKARQLGMKNTHFVNSYGLHDPQHLTSARDISLLARYALNFPELIELTSTKEYSLRNGEFKLYNTNKLLWWYTGTLGFKTGWTNEAKYCLVSSVKRNGLTLIAAVLGCPEARGNFRDSMKLYNYGFAKYGYRSFIAKGDVCGSVKVGKGVKDLVKVKATDDIGTIYLKGEEKKVTWAKNVNKYVAAPVKKGQVVGQAQVYINKKLVKTVNLVAAEDVAKCSPWQSIKRMWAKIFLL